VLTAIQILRQYVGNQVSGERRFTPVGAVIDDTRSERPKTSRCEDIMVTEKSG
jgi:hypothetical protein